MKRGQWLMLTHSSDGRRVFVREDLIAAIFPDDAEGVSALEVVGLPGRIYVREHVSVQARGGIAVVGRRP